MPIIKVRPELRSERFAPPTPIWKPYAQPKERITCFRCIQKKECNYYLEQNGHKKPICDDCIREIEEIAKMLKRYIE